ncbi:hypothetical protein J4H86_25135 [Spiractinospora alimapuensis]|uniref:hypothetical protein n=1 Tax=Spiractinospora alimapuensis TaxID=2820884 RepID=UPI001F1E21E5|nr:hypothetical protein [Spiractinospora alimapuensis]QVQ51983.1 hypothetical protein J4H86_25135 [Spiractinospora alimapuensis]
MSQPPYGNPPEGPYGGPGDPSGGHGPQDPSWAQPPYPPPGPSGPQPSYGAPNPYPEPQYWGGSGAPPPPGGPYGPPGPPPAPQRRGLLIGLIAAGAALVLIVVGVAAVLILRGGGMTHEATPQCQDIMPASLDQHVPDPELTRDEFAEHDFWDSLNCDWQSESGTAGAPGYAQVFLMRNEGNDPVGITEQDLENEILDRTTSPVDGIGDEAHSFYESASQWGCVAAITDNIYVVTCYDAAVDFMDLESIDEQAAIDGATQLSREVVGEIEARA